MPCPPCVVSTSKAKLKENMHHKDASYKEKKPLGLPVPPPPHREAVASMLADTPADEPHGDAAPAEEEEEPIVYDGPLPADIAGTLFAIFRAVDIWERLVTLCCP